MNKFRLLATLLVVALCTTTIFTSCRNDDDDDNGGTFEIRATNVSGNTSGITTVRAIIYGSNDNVLTVGEAPFQNNGFTLRLTNEIPASFLFPVTYMEYEGTLTISDRSARLAFIQEGICALNSGSNKIGVLWSGNERENASFWAFWIYADKNVTIRGTNDRAYYNLNLRRGWNTVYEHYSTGIERFTTQRPAGANLQWNFSDFSD